MLGPWHMTSKAKRPHPTSIQQVVIQSRCLDMASPRSSASITVEPERLLENDLSKTHHNKFQTAAHLSPRHACGSC